METIEHNSEIGLAVERAGQFAKNQLAYLFRRGSRDEREAARRLADYVDLMTAVVQRDMERTREELQRRM